jgi:Ca2+-binding EF-hand superfamily protein
MILRIPLLALTALLAAATSAQAASHDRDTFIREQDLDHDGKVTKDEFAKGRAAEFARMDKTHDGKLSNAEYVEDYRARLKARLAALPADQRDKERATEMHQAEVRFDVLDSDGNLFITPAEFDYSGWRMFMHHDTNKDGAVSRDDPPAKDSD